MRKRTLLLALTVGVLALAGFAFIKLAGDLPAPDALITRSSPDATKIYDRNGRLLYEILDPRAGRRTRLTLNQISPNLQRAVVAVEDANFYQNPGVEVAGWLRAAVMNLRAGRIVAGGSTITQQLARDLLLSREEHDSRSYTRKMREAFLALRLNQAYTKDQILEMYLNEMYFGELAYGAEAAARTYFGKSARDLDLAESALLAGMLQSPAAYDPLVDLDAATARQRIVLGLMVKHALITDAQAALAQSEPLHFVSAAQASTIHAPHFVIYVRSLLEARYGAEIVNHGGLRVITTLDLNLQERAEDIIRQQLAELTRRTREEGAPDYNVHDAALVALDPATGQVLAMVGSADYFDEQIDGAVNVALANRQPGSAIKPVTYATAFNRDYAPATVVSDVPTSFLTKEHQPYEPQNYDRIWHGPISLRQALATSSNMVAVKVLDHVGLDAMVATAKSLGISTFEDSERFGLALTLGGGEVKLIELTSAYAAFANQGNRVDPVAILSVNGNRSSAPVNPLPTQVSPQVAYLITSILSDNSARIGAFGEDNVLELSRPAAAKTGTTTDFRDNWTVGYSPDLAVGVWVGNADNTPMYKISGITGAGPIWHDFMEEALRSRPVRPFNRPEGLVDVEICDSSGLVPTDDCPRRRTEVFIAGTEPVRLDESYRALQLDAATGLLWAEGCRGPQVEQVYHILPPDAHDWGRVQGIPAPPSMDCHGQPVAQTSSEDKGSGIQGQGTGLSALLVVTSPAQNSTFAPSPQIPSELQRIEISARLNVALAVSGVSLLVDGKPIATFAGPPYRALWSLVEGDHTVQAVGVDGEGKRVESDPIHFQVEAGN
ncbi:MAG: penicillin-binding protein 1C [Acidobacteriota bacterium]